MALSILWTIMIGVFSARVDFFIRDIENMMNQADNQLHSEYKQWVVQLKSDGDKRKKGLYNYDKVQRKTLKYLKEIKAPFIDELLRKAVLYRKLTIVSIIMTFVQFCIGDILCAISRNN
jgi:hypothetical protein